MDRACLQRVVDDLIDIGDVAELLGVGKSRADTITRYRTFPLPVIDRPRLRMWWRPDVVEWRDANREP